MAFSDVSGAANETEAFVASVRRVMEDPVLRGEFIWETVSETIEAATKELFDRGETEVDEAFPIVDKILGTMLEDARDFVRELSGVDEEG